MTINDATPKRTLIALKSAIEDDSLLNQGTYGSGPLARIFGEHYNFRINKAGEQWQVVIDDVGNIYRDANGELTPLGKEMPCLYRGLIIFQSDGPTKKPNARISATIRTNAENCAGFSGDLLESIFGSHISTSEGFPSQPPQHGTRAAQAPSTHRLGNSWLKYRRETLGGTAEMNFRTNETGDVVEFNILIEGK